MTDLLSQNLLLDYPDSDGQPMTESDPTRDYLLYCVATLEAFFRGRPNTYVSGNLFIYYEEGNPKKSISPDVFVIFGVSKRKRRSYKTWQEGNKLPSFVLEVTSRSTKRQDEEEKPKLYAQLGVQEYFQYDPTGDYLKPQLKGSRLVDGEYQSIAVQTRPNGIEFISSAALGLDLCLQDLNWQGLMTQPSSLAKALRFFDPQTQTWLLNYEELEQTYQQTEQAKAQVEQERDQAQALLVQARERLQGMGMSEAEIAQILGQ